MEGPEPEFFNPISAMTLWNDAVKSRRPNPAGNCSYKKHNKKTRTLLDLEESSDKSNAAGETYSQVRNRATDCHFNAPTLRNGYRSSHQRCSIKEVVLKNSAIFTGKQLC